MSDFDTPWVDTIRVSGPITDHSFDRWNETCAPDENGNVVTLNTWGYTYIGSFRLDLRDQGKSAVLEGSIPRLRVGNNLQPASVAETVSALDGLLHESSTFVSWGVTADGLQLNRLDLDRDFHGVPDPSTFLGNLGRLPRRRTARFTGDSSLNESLKVATTTWQATLYDKHAESNSVRREHTETAREGHMRFEVRLRSKALRKQGLVRVADLQRVDLDSVVKGYFDRAGFNEVVGANEPLAVTLRRYVDHPSYKAAPAALGQEVMRSIGLPIPGAPATLRSRRAAGEEMGIIGALNAEGVRGHLNFTSRSFTPVPTPVGC